MANTLRFKRGLVAGIPNGALGEPLFTTDTFDLYIGNGTGNTRFQKYIASGATTQILRGDGSLYTFPLNISSPSNGQVLKYDGTNWVNSADAGVTGSGTAGQVTYWGSASTITGSNNLFWDATNNRLGIGTNAPVQALTVIGIASASTEFRLNNQSFTRIAIADTGGGFAGGYNLALSSGITPIHDSTGAVAGIHYRANGSIQFFTNSSQTANTNATERMRLFATGNLVINSTTDNGLRFQVTGDGFFSGSVGIGTTALTGVNLYVLKALTGSTQAVNVFSRGTIQSDVTQVASYFRTFAGTQAAAFTLSILRHFSAEQTAIGAGSAVSDQMGYYVDSTLIGATNNYGFYGNIASGTGRWNLYMNGTAQNYINGNLGVGVVTPFLKLDVLGSIGARGSNYVASWDSSTGDGIFMQYFGTYGDIKTVANKSLTFTIGTTERLRIDAAGNLGLGTSSPLNSTGYITLAVNGSTGGNIDLMSGGTRVASWNNTSTESYIGTRTNVPFAFTVNATEYARFFATTGNLRIGSSGSDAGFRLDVNGTMRVSGASTLSGGVTLGHTGGVAVTFPGGQAFRSNGGIFIDYGNGGTGDLVFRRGAGVTNTLTLAVADGAATFSSSVTAQTGLFGGNLGGANQRVANFRNSGGNAFIELQSSGAGAVGLWAASSNEFGIYQNATAGTIGTSVFYINSSGNVGVNTFTINASAKLQVESTTQGFLPPRMTTTQRNAIATPAAGLIVYDTTDNKHYGYNGTTWNAFY